MAVRVIAKLCAGPLAHDLVALAQDHSVRDWLRAVHGRESKIAQNCSNGAWPMCALIRLARDCNPGPFKAWTVQAAPARSVVRWNA